MKHADRRSKGRGLSLYIPFAFFMQRAHKMTRGGGGFDPSVQFVWKLGCLHGAATRIVSFQHCVTIDKIVTQEEQVQGEPQVACQS
jgi:hypothetical protein